MDAGKILVVDDDQNICELLRLYVEKEGFGGSHRQRRPDGLGSIRS